MRHQLFAVATFLAVVLPHVADAQPDQAQAAQYYRSALFGSIRGGDVSLGHELLLVTNRIAEGKSADAIQQYVNEARKERAELERQAAGHGDSTWSDISEDISSTGGQVGALVKSPVPAAAAFILTEVGGAFKDRILGGFNPSLRPEDVEARAQRVLGINNATARNKAQDTVDRFVLYLGEQSPRGDVAREIARRLGYDDKVGGDIRSDPGSRLGTALAAVGQNDPKQVTDLSGADPVRQKAAADAVLRVVRERLRAERQRTRTREQTAWDERTNRSTVDVVAFVLSRNPGNQTLARDFRLAGHTVIAAHNLVVQYQGLKKTLLNNVGLGLNMTALVLSFITGLSERPDQAVMSALKDIFELQKETLEAVQATFRLVASMDRKLDLYVANLADRLEEISASLETIQNDVRVVQERLRGVSQELKQLEDRINALAYGQIWTRMEELRRTCFTPIVRPDAAWAAACANGFNHMAAEEAAAEASRLPWPPGNFRESARLFPELPQLAMRLRLSDSPLSIPPNPDVWVGAAGLLAKFLDTPAFLANRGGIEVPTLLHQVREGGGRALAAQQFFGSVSTRAAVSALYRDATDQFIDKGLQDLWRRHVRKAFVAPFTNEERQIYSLVRGCSAPALDASDSTFIDALKDRYSDWLELARHGVGTLSVCGEFMLRVDERKQGHPELTRCSGGRDNRDCSVVQRREPTACNSTILARPRVTYTIDGQSIELSNSSFAGVAGVYVELAPTAGDPCYGPTMGHPALGNSLRNGADDWRKVILSGLRATEGGVRAPLNWPGTAEGACVPPSDRRCHLDLERRTIWQKGLQRFVNSLVEEVREPSEATEFGRQSVLLKENADAFRAVLLGGVTGYSPIAVEKTAAVLQLPDDGDLVRDLITIINSKAWISDQLDKMQELAKRSKKVISWDDLAHEVLVPEDFQVPMPPPTSFDGTTLVTISPPASSSPRASRKNATLAGVADRASARHVSAIAIMAESQDTDGEDLRLVDKSLESLLAKPWQAPPPPPAQRRPAAARPGGPGK